MLNNLLLVVLILLGVLGITAFVLYSIRMRRNMNLSLDMVFLKISIPRLEDDKDSQKEKDRYSASSDFKEVIGIMMHFFENLYSIYNRDFKYRILGQAFLSFEIVVKDNLISFYIVCPRSLEHIVEKQITSFYSDALIENVPDYNIFKENSKVEGCYMYFPNKNWLPIRTFQNMPSDPLSTTTNVLSKFAKDEGAVIQMVVRPKRGGWQSKGRAYAGELSSKGEKASSNFVAKFFGGISDFVTMMIKGPDENANKSPDAGGNKTPRTDEKIKAIEAKCGAVGFETVIRVVTSGETHRQAKMHLGSITSAFTQFSNMDGNGLRNSKIHSTKKLIVNFMYRNLERDLMQSLIHKKMIMCPEEMASVYHFPNIRYNKAPNINWLKYKIAPPPDNIPTEGLLLGHNIYRGVKTPIYMKNEDRFSHFYVIGQTGTGKSSIFQTMIRQDLREGRGVAIIDPHGSLIEDILPFIPRSRADDVIYFNPADLDRPMGWNLLDAETDDEKERVAMDLMNIMIKLFNEEIFGPRIQDYFRNGVLTLMAPDDPDERGTLVDIVRLFTDDAYEKHMVPMIKNPVVKNFWTNQMAKTGQREKQEMIPYFAAKFGQFISNKMMRNILGQTRSAFDVSKAMQEGKIFLINLSKGLTGDINSKLLGMLIVTRIQNAALMREKMRKEDRTDFFLYIDEFQNFITDSIESILSEARKYRLGLCLAHQYIKQLEGSDPKSPSAVKEAVFGNVGTMMCYKIGAQDAEFMAKEMAPVFSEQDLINIDKFKAVMKLSIDTQPSRAFSIIPSNPYLETGDKDASEAFKQLSRLKYGRDVEFVNREICKRIGII